MPILLCQAAGIEVNPWDDSKQAPEQAGTEHADRQHNKQKEGETNAVISTGNRRGTDSVSV